jgi:hypothetical protein
MIGGGELSVNTSKSNRIKVGEYIHLSDNLYCVHKETKDELGYISVAKKCDKTLDSTTVTLLKCKCKKGLEKFVNLKGEGIMDRRDEVFREGYKYFGKLLPVLLDKMETLSEQERADFIDGLFIAVDEYSLGRYEHG